MKAICKPYIVQKMIMDLSHQFLSYFEPVQRETIGGFMYTVCPKNNRTLYLNHTTCSAIY